MIIVEKIIGVLEWSSKKDLKTYTEEELRGFAETAYMYAIGAIFIPILIIMPFQYAKKAKQSSNADIAKKAKQAEYIALIYLLLLVGFIIYLSISS
jgi:hypothetical protein